MININDYPLIIIKCLAITVIVELLFALIIGIKDKKDLLDILLVNVATNPLSTTFLLYINMRYVNKYHIPSWIVLEIFVFLIEGLIYTKVLKYDKLNGFIVSFMLNISSIALGYVIDKYWI